MARGIERHAIKRKCSKGTRYFSVCGKPDLSPISIYINKFKVRVREQAGYGRLARITIIDKRVVP